MKSFDELIGEKGGKVPYPRYEAVYTCLDADIRKARDEIIDLEWAETDDWKLLHNKRLWLQYLMGERRRGMTKRMVGTRQVMEINYEKAQ